MAVVATAAAVLAAVLDLSLEIVRVVVVVVAVLVVVAVEEVEEVLEVAPVERRSPRHPLLRWLRGCQRADLRCARHTTHVEMWHVQYVWLWSAICY